MEDITPIKKLDYSLKSAEERRNLVEEIIAATPPENLTPRYLEILSDYIVFAMDQEEKKKKEILTDNRLVTINARETSFEGLTDKLENGEDGIYNMFAGNDKNIIFSHKVQITQKDLEEIPALRALKESIEQIEKKVIMATGKKKYILKKQLIELYQNQYIIKNFFRKPIYGTKLTKSFSKQNLDENITVTKDGEVISDGRVTLFNKDHISAILCNYSLLKESSEDKISSDLHFLMDDFDELLITTLKEKYPLQYDLVLYKIQGKQNIEIQKALEEKHGIKHSVEYISSLQRNKIPKLLAEKAQENYLIWYYTNKEKGKYKRCSRCGQIKLAHNRFFSKNKTSKDGFYSICKECRNKK